MSAIVLLMQIYFGCEKETYVNPGSTFYYRFYIQLTIIYNNNNNDDILRRERSRRRRRRMASRQNHNIHIDLGLLE